MPSGNSVLAKEFQKHADGERRYLVEFRDHEYECPAMNFGPEQKFQTVNDLSEIVPLLKELNKARLMTYLASVYDLKTVLPANGEPQALTLKPEMLKSVESFYEARRLEQRRKDWDNRSWNFKIFSKRP